MQSNALVVEREGKRQVVYEPFPHQQRFHQATKKFVIMEGSRGGGKSKAMRFDAYIRCLTTPHFRALLVRRSMPELRDSHLQWVPFEAEQLGLAKDAWHSTNFLLRFPNHSVLRFSHIEDDNALTKLLSSEWEIIYVDELATFTYRQYAFLLTSLRSPIPGYQPVLRGATNPVGIGAAWVKAFFIDKNPDPLEFPDYDPAQHEAITCNMTDNPAINPAEYAKMFANLPSQALKDALLHGKWVIEGQFFSEWLERKVIDEKEVGWHVIDALPTYRGRPITEAAHIEIVRAIDWGYAPTGNPGVCLWFACLPDGSAIGFQEYVFRETLPHDVAAEIKRRSENLKVRYTVADTQMWAEHEGPSIAEHFARAGLAMIEADKVREAGWIEVHNWLRTTVNDGLRERPRLSFLREGCPLTVRAMPQMIVDPKYPADMETRGVQDDGPDCVRYFVMSRPSASKKPKPPPHLDWIYKEMRKTRGAGRLGSESVRR